MNLAVKPLMTCVAIAGIGMLGLSALLTMAGARINTTKSLPLGLYWASHEPIEKGAYVLFCPPQRDVFDEAKERGYIGSGFCPGGYGLMMKRVAGVQDDIISVNDQGVVVNGKGLPYSMPLKTDQGKRPLPSYRVERHRLEKTELLLMSDVSATSFDSRYFGPISCSQIKTTLFPVITWR